MNHRRAIATKDGQIGLWIDSVRLGYSFSNIYLQSVSPHSKRSLIAQSLPFLLGLPINIQDKSDEVVPLNPQAEKVWLPCRAPT